MRRNLLFACLGFVGILAAWLAFRAAAEGPPPTAAGPDAAETRADQSADASGLEPGVRAGPARTAIAAEEPKNESQPEAIPVADPDAALLVVRPVSNVDRKPLANVRVSVHRVERDETSWQSVPGIQGDMTHAPISGAECRVELVVPAGIALEVWAEGEDDRSGSARLQVPAIASKETREVVIELPCGDDLGFFGRVVDKETDLPVANAKIELRRGGGWSSDEKDHSRRLAETRSDSSGVFELRLASWMGPFLRIDADGYGMAMAQPRAGHESENRAMKLLISRSATLRGTVVDASGKSIPQASIRLKSRGYDLRTGREEGEHLVLDFVDLPDQLWKADLDDHGRCTIAGLPASTRLEVEIRKGTSVLRREGEMLQLEPGQVLERTWTIGSGCRIEGLVVDQSGAPVAALGIWLMKHEWGGEKYVQSYEDDSAASKTKSDEQGRFVLKDVSPGTWWLAPAPTRGYGKSATADAIAPLTQTIEVGNGTQTVTLKVSRGLYVRGRVEDSAGKPMKGAHVGSQQGEQVFGMDVTTQDDGTFALGPLGPGTCKLWANGPKDAADSEPITAEPGQEGIVLRLRTGGGLSVRVVDGRIGKPCTATVHLRPEHPLDTPMGAGWMTNVDEDGLFQHTGLLPDHYHLVFYTVDGRFATLPDLLVVAGKESSGHVATLSPGGKLELRNEGKQAALFTVTHRKAHVTFPSWVEPGKPDIVPVPAGQVVVEYRAQKFDEPEMGGPLRTVSVEVRAGETASVVLTDDG